MSRTRVLLSLSHSLFSQPSHVIWHKQFPCTARSPHSLHPDMADISLLSTTPHPPRITGATLASLGASLFRLPFIPCHPLIIFPLHHFPRHLDITPPTLDRPNIIVSLPLSLRFPWFLPLSPSFPHRLYILRTCSFSINLRQPTPCSAERGPWLILGSSDRSGVTYSRQVAVN